jgi:molybdenum ABC transporter molybdate-binding protein
MPKTAPKKAQQTAWTREWSVGIRVWVARSGEAVLGEGRAELLAAIGRLRSITKAAKAVKISYRKAWSLVQEINSAAGEPLVEAAVGGVKGGGARLTDRGKLVLSAYEQVRRALHQSAAGALQRTVTEESSAAACLHLAAAISLQDAVTELLAEYALVRPTVRVRAVFGASNELADHILGGAPCDLFIAAEAREIDRLEQAHRLAPGTRKTVATNGLAVIGQNGAAALRNVSKLLSPEVRRIALAEPACPLGRYSKAFLESEGIYKELLTKVTHVDNSRAVPSAVAAGSAEVGIAFESDAVRASCDILLRVPKARSSAKYVGGVVRGGVLEPEARELMEFLGSARAVRCFRRWGLFAGSSG